jgi:hypothetical protein
MAKYGHNLFIAADQLFNALIGGYPDETYSSRAWRERESKPFRRWLLDFVLGKDHCERAWNWERMDMHSPEEFRDVV